MYVPLLPGRGEENKLIFNLTDKYQEVYASLELKYAPEEGYVITKVYNAFGHEKREGLFKEYVEFFYKM